MKQLEKSQVHLWFAGLENFDLCLVYEKYTDWLSSEEIDRMSLYQSRRQREHFVLGRILLKLILSKYINCEPSTFKFHSDKRGKLFLCPSNKPSLFFNVSHSHDRLVIAVSRIRELGVFSMANFIPVKVANSDTIVNMIAELKKYKQKKKYLNYLINLALTFGC